MPPPLTLIGSGDLEGAGGVWGGPSSAVVPVTPGAYTMVVTYDKYHVGGQQGLATLSATFDTEAVDKNPPTLHSLRVLSPEGEPTDTVTPTGARLIELVFDEFLSEFPVVEYSLGNDEWQAIPVSESGFASYSAELPDLPSQSLVSLRMTAHDDAQNSLEYLLAPAFSVDLRTPAPLTPSEDHATQDTDVNFQWEGVTTATEYRIQVDTASTFDSPDLVEATVAGMQHTIALPKAVHFWRVLARDSALNESGWSAVVHFTIADPAIQVTTDSARDRDPSLTRTTDGTLWVSWRSCRADCRIWHSTSEDSGATWSQEIGIEPVGNDYRPSIAGTSGDKVLLVFYSWHYPDQNGQGRYDIFHRVYDPKDGGWQEATQLTDDLGYDHAPSVAGSDSRIWVVWESDRNENTDLWIKSSTDDGATRSAASQLTDDSSSDYDPSHHPCDRWPTLVSLDP